MLLSWIYTNKPDFYKIIFSNPFSKNDAPKKITLRKLPSLYQIEIQNTQATHYNFSDASEALAFLEPFGSAYKQCNIISEASETELLLNRLGHIHVTSHQIQSTAPALHNRQKKYIIEEGIPTPWLIALGIMTKEGKVKKNQYPKFRQFNRFLEFIQSVEHKIPNNATIIDFGCGKSYLTFALYGYLHRQLGKDINIYGFDLKKDVIKDCQALADSLGYAMSFQAMDIKNFTTEAPVHMVISLHACDTATDYAIYHGIRLQSEIIMSVPCCQYEIRKQIKNKDLSLLLSQGIIKEEFSALVTDTIRVALLNDYGYHAQIMEFIELEHTKKNKLIRASKSQKENIGISSETKSFINMFGLRPTLEVLLENT